MASSGPSVEGFTLMSLGVSFIIFRMGVRWNAVGPANFQLDDYLMPLAGVSRRAQTFWWESELTGRV